MRLSIRYDQETGLMDIIASGGNLSVSQAEAAMLYTILGKALGFRGRLKLWMHRKDFKTLAE